MSLEPSALIELGVVGAPFGVQGWMKLRSFTDPPEGLLEHERVHLKVGGAWRVYAIETAGRSAGQLTVKLRGIDDRDSAQRLRGAVVGLPRSELPRPRSGEFYRADLIGCDVVNVAGTRLGTVSHFIEIPAHALMVVRGEREYWVPAAPQHLRRVELEARRVVVDWDEPID